MANDVHGLQDRLEGTWEEPKAKDRRPGFFSDLLHDLGEVMAASSPPLPVPLPPALATTHLFSVSLFCRYVDLYHILDSTYK